MGYEKVIDITYDLIIDSGMEPDFDIEAICRDLKVSQTEVAAALGLTQSAVSRWRPGKRQPTGAAKILLRKFIEERERAA